MDDETVYGPFRTEADAEWFSHAYSSGRWGVVQATTPNHVNPLIGHNSVPRDSFESIEFTWTTWKVKTP